MIEWKTRSLSNIHIGLYVVHADTGKVIFDHNGSKLFTSASNLKIITKACALKTLGPTYRFRTDKQGLRSRRLYPPSLKRKFEETVNNYPERRRSKEPRRKIVISTQ